MLAGPIVAHSDQSGATTCPRLGLARDPGSHYAVPCPFNICHADPLRRKGPRDLPLTCQADCCLTPGYRRCPYWQNARGETLSLAGFIVRQIRAVCAVCARALQP